MQECALPNDYWEAVWDRVPLPQLRVARRSHELHAAFRAMLPTGQRRLLEVGCAPGAWMAYFAREFGYRVSGIELAPRACQKTIENLKMLKVEGEVTQADFFSCEPRCYDIVSSFGFIEHFEDPDGAVQRLIANADPQGGFVITSVPNMQGLNWAISRRFRPEVAAGHYPMNLERLVRLHERRGLKTLVARHTGGLQLLRPIEKNDFAAAHPLTSRCLNAPFAAWSRAVSLTTRTLRRYPQTPWVATGMLYIGVRS